jgi:glyoxylase-like metal-dependent hydrolase (beta-lactamase superfamily II)
LAKEENIGLSVGDEGVLLIDSQFNELTEKILSAIDSKTDKPTKLFINTQWHQDHTGGND